MGPWLYTPFLAVISSFTDGSLALHTFSCCYSFIYRWVLGFTHLFLLLYLHLQMGPWLYTPFLAVIASFTDRSLALHTFSCCYIFIYRWVLGFAHLFLLFNQSINRQNFYSAPYTAVLGVVNI